ncbi:MAG: molybdopterin-dependent oxidoreductase [Paraclostridium sp.]
MKKISQACTLDCFDCCKFNIYTDKGKISKIEGDKDHPYTKGMICKKGRAHLERLDHKDRIYTPLLKVDNEWKEISFEEAISIIANKLIYYKEKYTSKSILYHEQYGNGGLLKSIGEIFFNFYGGVSKAKGGPCWSAGISAQKYDFGEVRSNSIEDMLNSKSIFIWGKNPAFTTIHTMQVIKQAKNRGIKIIVIDPIYTETAKLADKYIRVNPGTDGALALAMAKIIIEKDLYNTAYIKSYVLGFKEYKSYLNSLKLEYLCEECGVDKETINELVNIYTDIYCNINIGYGVQKYTNGGNAIRAIDSLAIITGQVGFSGGGVSYANRIYPSILNTDPYKSYLYGQNRLFYLSNLSKFIEEPKAYSIDKSDNTPIKMAVITKSNLLNQLPNLQELELVFSSIEFKVCIDMFMTDTAKQCDLFIPCTSTLESEDLIYSSMTNPYITYNDQVIMPKNSLMDEYYLFNEIAKIIGLKNYPIVSKRDYLELVIQPLQIGNKSISIDDIKNNYITIEEKVAWKEKIFETPSKKIELLSSIAKEETNHAMVRYISPIVSNKFRLITNHYRDTLFSQHFMDKEGISQAYINSKMADKLKLTNGDIVKLESKNINIETQININDSVGDSIVMMYVGWWKKHGNPNYITDTGISDMGGQITYNETFVDIIKQN